VQPGRKDEERETEEGHARICVKAWIAASPWKLSEIGYNPARLRVPLDTSSESSGVSAVRLAAHGSGREVRSSNLAPRQKTPSPLGTGFCMLAHEC